MAQALDDLGVGALRFPYGHLADFYLWHDGPYDQIERSGLNPRFVGKRDLVRQWRWAFNPDGTHRGAMDFDEYIALCKQLNAKPLVVVNTLSMFTDPAITREKLIESAAEWVRYAKQKDYPVAYWSIGNEVDHGPATRHMSREEYFDLYVDMVTAMKAVDPTIRTGPGILGRIAYYRQALSLDPGLVDFLCVHQYMFYFRTERADPAWQTDSFRAWQDSSSTQPYRNVESASATLQEAGREEVELLVTETGITGAPENSGSTNNLWKSLWWLEVLMHQAQTPRVSYSFYWGAHSPWYGNTEDDLHGRDHRAFQLNL